MNVFTDVFGAIFVIVGLAYIFKPEKIFPYDEWTITRHGLKKEIPKMTKDWVNGARVKGVFFLIVGLLIVFLEELVGLLHG